MKLVLTDWCFNTCIWDKTPDGFKPWGYTLTKASDGSYSVNHCFWCDVAVLIQYFINGVCKEVERVVYVRLIALSVSWQVDEYKL